VEPRFKKKQDMKLEGRLLRKRKQMGRGRGKDKKES
jgi:hypothetical protein